MMLIHGTFIECKNTQQGENGSET